MGDAQMRGFSRRIGNPGGRPGVPRAPPESCGPLCPPAASRPPAVSLPPASPASHSARVAAETGCCFLAPAAAERGRRAGACTQTGTVGTARRCPAGGPQEEQQQDPN